MPHAGCQGGDAVRGEQLLGFVLAQAARCRGQLQLRARQWTLGRMPRAELAFIIAGGDVLRGDRFGTLGLSLEGARRRDRRVAPAVAKAVAEGFRVFQKTLDGQRLKVAMESEQPWPAGATATAVLLRLVNASATTRHTRPHLFVSTDGGVAFLRANFADEVATIARTLPYRESRGIDRDRVYWIEVPIRHDDSTGCARLEHIAVHGQHGGGRPPPGALGRRGPGEAHHHRRERDRLGRRRDRATAIVRNTSYYARWVEYGTERVPAHQHFFLFIPQAEEQGS